MIETMPAPGSALEIPNEVPRKLAIQANEKATIALRAAAIVVNNDAELEAARNFLVDVKTTHANIEADRVSIKRPLDEAVARVQVFFRKLLTPLELAEGIVKPKIAAYLAAQEAERKAEEARQRAEADRLRREQEAEARRAQEAADRERARAEQEAKTAQAEAERQERIRLAAEKQGNAQAAARAAARSAEAATAASNALAAGEQKASTHLEAASQSYEASAGIATPSVAAAERPAGTSFRWTFKAECGDLRALCAAIGAGKAPVTLVEFAQGPADRMAGVMKDGFEGAYPGVKLIKKPDVSQRTR